MAAQRYKDFLFSYSGLISSTEEIKIISDYFEQIKASVSQADCSELTDLTKYTIHRNAMKIRAVIRSNKPKPFVFITCLN
jgi:hypothetical protein